MEILKSAEGKNYNEARNRAKAIRYGRSLVGNELLLDSYFITEAKSGYRDQEVQITLYLPEGTTLFADDNTSTFHRNTDSYEDILHNGEEEHFLKIIDGGTSCEDCPVEDVWDDDNKDWNDEDTWEDDYDTSDDFNARVDVNSEEVNIRLNDNGVEIQDKDGDRVRIDSNGVQIQN